MRAPRGATTALQALVCVVEAVPGVLGRMAGTVFGALARTAGAGPNALRGMVAAVFEKASLGGVETALPEGGSAAAEDDPSVPVRPSVPPLLACALSLWLSLAAVLSALQGAGEATAAGVAVAGCAACVAVCVVVWKARGEGGRFWIAVVCVGLAAGAALGGMRAVALHEDGAAVDGLAGPMGFVAVEDGREGAFGGTCYANLALEGGRTVVVRLLLPADVPLPRFGEAVEGIARLNRSSGQNAPFAWQKGCVADVRLQEASCSFPTGPLGAFASFRSQVIDAIEASETPGAGVLAALVCGYRGGLDDADYNAFKAAGLAHVVAVSGAHLSIVMGLVGLVLIRLGVRRSVAIVAQALFMGGFVVFAGMPPSALRAAVMAASASTAFFVGRRAAPLNALALCVIGTLALSPSAGLSVAFALSALSTLGIVAFSGLAAWWLRALAPVVPRWARDAVALTLASSLLTLPLSAALFSQAPLVAPIANVVVAPLFAPVCGGGLIVAALAVVMPPLQPLLGLACAGAEALTQAARLVTVVPFASVPVDASVPGALAVSAVGGALLWWFWPKPNRKAAAGVVGAFLAAAAVVLGIAPAAAGTEIVMLDVGQGDAFVVRSQGASVLVDTGNRDGLLREGLARHGIVRLDAVVITHGDDDHMGSLASLAGVVGVDRVVVAADALECPCRSCDRLRTEAVAVVGSEGLVGVEQGAVLQVGDFELHVVWPATFADNGGNGDSLCLLAAVDYERDGIAEWKALFTGDAERKQLDAMLDAGLVGEVDVLKVGHHGSKNALDDESAAVLAPEVALVSCGANNRYGHPAPEALASLEAAGAQIFRTDQSGDVICTFTKESLSVTAQRFPEL